MTRTQKTFWIHDFNYFITVILLTIKILVLASSFTSFVFTEGILQYTSTPEILIPAITQNTLTIVSLLIGTSSFISGLRIQNLTRSTSSTTSSSKTPSSSRIMNKLSITHGDIDTGTSYPIHIHYHFWNNPGWNTVWAWRSCLFTTTVCFFYSSRSNTASN